MNIQSKATLCPADDLRILVYLKYFINFVKYDIVCASRFIDNYEHIIKVNCKICITTLTNFTFSLKMQPTDLDYFPSIVEKFPIGFYFSKLLAKAYRYNYKITELLKNNNKN